jgi:hypothetical protein
MNKLEELTFSLFLSLVLFGLGMLTLFFVLGSGLLLWRVLVAIARTGGFL